MNTCVSTAAILSVSHLNSRTELTRESYNKPIVKESQISPRDFFLCVCHHHHWFNGTM